MVYPSDYENKTGFDRIRAQVRGKCTTDGGRALLDGEGFSASAGEIAHRLSLCSELQEILMLESGFPLQEYTDIGPVARKIEVACTFLDIEDMIALRAGLGAVNEITVFLAAKEEGRYPVLRGLAQGVESFPEITGHIDTILDRYGKIKDSASPELYLSLIHI